MNEEQGHNLMKEIEHYLAQNDQEKTSEKATAPALSPQLNVQSHRQLYTQLILAGIGAAGIIWHLKNKRNKD